MELEFPIKSAFMGIAVLNICGYTMDSFLYAHLVINEDTGSTKFKLKQKYNVDNILTKIGWRLI